MSPFTHRLLVFGFMAIVVVAHGRKKDKSPVVKSDLQYIRCSTCEVLAKELLTQTKAKREAIVNPKKKLEEFEIIELTEKICNPDSTEGIWIAHLDMVEQGDRIKLVKQDDQGRCKSECRTIARACEDIIEEASLDIAETLYQENVQRALISKLLCRELTSACTKKVPKVPPSRSPIEEFEAMSQEEIDMEEMMRSMEGMEGMPGMDMFSREDLMEQYGLNDYDDTYDDIQDIYEDMDDIDDPPPREDEKDVIGQIGQAWTKATSALGSLYSTAKQKYSNFVGSFRNRGDEEF